MSSGVTRIKVAHHRRSRCTHDGSPERLSPPRRPPTSGAVDVALDIDVLLADVVVNGVGVRVDVLFDPDALLCDRPLPGDRLFGAQPHLDLLFPEGALVAAHGLVDVLPYDARRLALQFDVERDRL